MNNTSLVRSFFSQVDVAELVELFNLQPELNFFVKDLRGRFLAINQRGCEYCGALDQNEVIGKTDFDFFPSQRAESYRQDDEQVMRTGEPIINRLESAPEMAGSPRLVMTSKIPLRNVEGVVVGIAGFSRQVDTKRGESKDAKRFAKVVEYLHSNYHRKLKTSELAAKAKLSISQFERQFRRVFGVSPRQYLSRVRLEIACRKLAQTDETVATIAGRCGFFDHAHFSRCFRKQMNVSPSEYRRSKNSESKLR
jgi:PAS domain S-box-containing protein